MIPRKVTLIYYKSSIDSNNERFAENLLAVDFKGEAITFKTTTAAVIDTLAHCAELVAQREESWRKRLEREKERRKHSEILAQKYFEQMQKTRNVHPGPDLEVSLVYLSLYMYSYIILPNEFVLFTSVLLVVL